MQIKSVIPYILALTFVCGCGNADKTARKGEAALAIGEYYGAAEYFKKAYTQTPSKDKPKRALLALKMGQCYAHIGYASRAVGAFQNAIRYGLTDTTAYFQLGEMQRLTGQYKVPHSRMKITSSFIRTTHWPCEDWKVAARRPN